MKRVLVALSIIGALLYFVSTTDTPSVDSSSISTDTVQVVANQDTPENLLQWYYTNLTTVDSATYDSLCIAKRSDYPLVKARVTALKNREIRVESIDNLYAEGDLAVFCVNSFATLDGLSEPMPARELVVLKKKDGKWYLYNSDSRTSNETQAILEVSKQYAGLEETKKFQQTIQLFVNQNYSFFEQVNKDFIDSMNTAQQQLNEALAAEDMARLQQDLLDQQNAEINTMNQ